MPAVGQLDNNLIEGSMSTKLDRFFGRAGVVRVGIAVLQHGNIRPRGKKLGQRLVRECRNDGQGQGKTPFARQLNELLQGRGRLACVVVSPPGLTVTVTDSCTGESARAKSVSTVSPAATDILRLSVVRCCLCARI